ncbi:hypothetical protein CNR22_06315 [Sphingobacteriaceae bacterium]|nr:hypothetical protein CNR22_06315 [Sphingobacteriaceae bacterium]
MLNALDNYFLTKEEPVKGCLLFLREYILKQDKNITEAWKYGMPFYCYKGKMFCYLWVHKKYLQPYIGIVEGAKINHPDLLQEKRARMKILLVDATKDIPVKKIDRIMGDVLRLYRT